LATDRSACEERREESDNLAESDFLAQEIVEDLEAALEQFREIAADLGLTRLLKWIASVLELKFV